MEATKNKNPAAVALGRLGGLAGIGKRKPTSGFASKNVLEKAMATRRKNNAQKEQRKAEIFTS